jgi:hypothetical protein
MNGIMNPKKSLTAFVLLLLLPVFFAPVTDIRANDQSAPEKMLQFLTDVAVIDVNTYDPKLVYCRDYSGVSSQFDEAVKYNLTSADSRIEVIGIFRDHVLVSCNLNVIKGLPRFAQSAVSSLDSARSFFERYLNYSQASYLIEMRNTLNSISELVPMSKSFGNIKLNVSIDNGRTLVKWIYSINGIDASYNSVSVGFRYGAFEGFSDEWNRYEIGSSEARITRDAAIRIAKSAAYNSSFVVSGLTVTPNFTILDDPVIATLSLQPKADNRLYPLWEIKLVLDRVILGSTGGFQVALWADSGEVAFVTSTGMLGVPTENNTVTPEPSAEPSPSVSPSPLPLVSPHIDPTPSLSALPSPTQSQEPSASSSLLPADESGDQEGIDYALLVVVVVCVGVVVAASLFLLRRRRAG